MAPLVREGACGFKLSVYETDPDRFPRIDDHVLWQVLPEIARHGVPVGFHGENDLIIEDLIARAKVTAARTPWPIRNPASGQRDAGDPQAPGAGLLDQGEASSSTPPSPAPWTWSSGSRPRAWTFGGDVSALPLAGRRAGPPSRQGLRQDQPQHPQAGRSATRCGTTSWRDGSISSPATTRPGCRSARTRRTSSRTRPARPGWRPACR